MLTVTNILLIIFDPQLSVIAIFSVGIDTIRQSCKTKSLYRQQTPVELLFPDVQCTNTSVHFFDTQNYYWLALIRESGIPCHQGIWDSLPSCTWS